MENREKLDRALVRTKQERALEADFRITSRGEGDAEVLIISTPGDHTSPSGVIFRGNVVRTDTEDDLVAKIKQWLDDRANPDKPWLKYGFWN